MASLASQTGDTGSAGARRRARVPVAAVILLGLLIGLGPVTAARADGDPASDALISENVFYPYSSPVPQADQTRLNAAVGAAHAAGVPLKVAIIARRVDLGSVTALYGDPQRYAAFLDTEISYRRKVPLLVVMSDGFGVEGLPAAARRRILGASFPAGSGGTGLARAATTAVTRALGGPARGAAGAGGSTGTASRTILLLALILAAILVAGALVLLRVLAPPTRV